MKSALSNLTKQEFPPIPSLGSLAGEEPASKENPVKLTDDMKIKELKKKYCRILSTDDIKTFVRENFKEFIKSFFKKLVYDETIDKPNIDANTQQNSLRRNLDKYIENEFLNLFKVNIESNFMNRFYIIQLLSHNFLDVQTMTI